MRRSTAASPPKLVCGTHLPSLPIHTHCRHGGRRWAGDKNKLSEGWFPKVMAAPRRKSILSANTVKSLLTRVQECAVEGRNAASLSCPSRSNVGATYSKSGCFPQRRGLARTCDQMPKRTYNSSSLQQGGEPQNVQERGLRHCTLRSASGGLGPLSLYFWGHRGQETGYNLPLFHRGDHEPAPALPYMSHLPGILVSLPAPAKDGWGCPHSSPGPGKGDACDGQLGIKPHVAKGLADHQPPLPGNDGQRPETRDP